MLFWFTDSGVFKCYIVQPVSSGKEAATKTTRHGLSGTTTVARHILHVRKIFRQEKTWESNKRFLNRGNVFERSSSMVGGLGANEVQIVMVYCILVFFKSFPTKFVYHQTTLAFLRKELNQLGEKFTKDSNKNSSMVWQTR